MEIEALKDALGEKDEPLKQYVDDLIGQRDAARGESISGRKKLKARVEDLETQVSPAHAGIDLREAMEGMRR